ncbi:MFS general substrate transporter [Xylariaceae sp. FL1272]|nr:MFS general substrate transporter [Xylariaceae sp. FL1272]
MRMASHSHNSASAAPESNGETPQPSPRRSIHFWGTFVALCLISFLCALDAIIIIIIIIITTALPTIIAPLLGQISDIYGRRGPFIASTVLFLVGSAVVGASRNAGMLIGGRVVQGLGAGGLYVLLDIVCCDLTSLRERGKFVGLMSSFAGLTAALGPALGGVIAQADWLNNGAARETAGGKSRLRRLEDVGSLIFVASTISVLLGLGMRGVQFSWLSYHVVVPLVLGVAGWVGFQIQQFWFSKPPFPVRLFRNRTSAVLNQTVTVSGTNYLPYAIGTLVSAVIGGVVLSRTGVYKPIHAVSFAVSVIGFGLFTLLDAGTSKVAYVFFQLISSFGLGPTVSTLLPAIMAMLPESDVASVTALYVFVKTFGYVWGVTIASILFNAAFDANIHIISAPNLRYQLSDGAAYAFASQLHWLQNTFDPTVLAELRHVYVLSMKVIWWTGLGTSIVGFLACC